MLSGRTPGEIGVYGFRNRADRSYSGLSVATSRSVRVPRLWDLLTADRRASLLLGVPGTYPPPVIRGCVVGDFLAPSTNAHFTYPRWVADDISQIVDEYILDVFNFRTEEKSRIAQQILDMTEQRFTLARHFVTSQPWDFFAMVDMGPDRLHHGFWRYCDPDHPLHEPGNSYESVFREYYRALDKHLASLLSSFDDDTAVLVVSDHGAQPMVGGFCLSEWLVSEGLLVLSEEPSGRTPVAEAKIDWSRTTAWGDGGYYGRIFLNVAGREPLGTISQREYEDVRQEIIDKLEGLPDHEGRPMGNRAFRPEEIYPEVNGVAPDLIVYFGDLRWRAIGTLGLGHGFYTFENDTGPDDANHSEFGIFSLSGDGLPTGFRGDLSIFDVAPTLQSVLGLSPPPGQGGRALA
jgi:predicted AlkP superfamily phosphohydrolase/phosphomutase